MGASFRNTGQVLELAGCDRLTISPALLAKLSASTEPAAVKLSAGDVAARAPEAAPPAALFPEPAFRWSLNEDVMASEKLAEGIRAFAADLGKLETFLSSLAVGAPAATPIA